MEYVNVFGEKYVDLQHALGSFEVLSQISELLIKLYGRQF